MHKVLGYSSYTLCEALQECGVPPQVELEKPRVYYDTIGQLTRDSIISLSKFSKELLLAAAFILTASYHTIYIQRNASCQRRYMHRTRISRSIQSTRPSCSP